ncbi:MAG: hypothetical protein ACOX8Q_08840 [Christensenellales bacterium]
MAGVSVFILKVDDELKELLDYKVNTIMLKI